MSDAEQVRRFAIVVIGSSDDTLERLHNDLDEITGGAIEIVVATSAQSGEALVLDLVGAGVSLPLVIVEDGLVDPSGPELLLRFHDRPELEPTRKVLLTPRPSLNDVDTAFRRGALHGMLSEPWSRDGLLRQVRSHLARWLHDIAPDDVDRFAALVSEDVLARAARSSEESRRVGDRRIDDEDEPFLLDDDLTSRSLHDAWVARIDNALGHPPRLVLAAGAVLIEEGDDVGGVYVILDGAVRLTRRSEIGDLVVHDSPFGGIVGLLSLTQRQRAFLHLQGGDASGRHPAHPWPARRRGRKGTRPRRARHAGARRLVGRAPA